MEPQGEPVVLDAPRVTDEYHRRIEAEMAMHIRPGTRKSYARNRKNIIRFLRQYRDYQSLVIGEEDFKLDEIDAYYSGLEDSQYGPSSPPHPPSSLFPPHI